MSDPPPKKVGSLRDRIAAFENKGGAAAPTPPAPRPKPVGGASWKPRPRSPPPVSNEETPGASKPGGMSAADAKASIGQGGSLKERMAALQGLHAFGGAPAPPPPKPATEKPKWKPPPVVSPPPTDDDERDEAHKPAAAQEAEHDTQEEKQTEEGEHAEQKDEGEAEPDPEEEERQRRAAIAARMARLGGARVGMAPPVFGRKPDVKKHETHNTEGEEHTEKKPAEHTAAVSPPAENIVTKPPGTDSVTSQKPDTDYSESKDTAHLSPESAPSPPIRSPAMPVPAAPRRAAPPRKRPAKSPSPAPATVLQEGTVNESPSPLPDVPPAAPEVSAPSAVQTESIGPHGDREPEVTGSKVEAMLESMHVSEADVAEEPKEPLNTPPAIAAGSSEEQPKEAALHAQEEEQDVDVTTHEVATRAESQEEVEPTAAVIEEHQQVPEEHHSEVEGPTHAERGEPEEETEEEEAARRKRIAERLAKAGGVNPLGGPLYSVPHPPTSPPLGHEVPASLGRRQSLRKDSRGSVASEHPSSPLPVPTSPRPEVPRRQGSVHSVHSQASAEHPTRRASQDERRHSVEVHDEPAPVAVRAIAEEIVEEPEPHDYHEAVPEEQELAEDGYLQKEAEDEHEPVQYDEPTPIEEEYDVQVEEEEVPPPPPPRAHPNVTEASPPARSPSKRLSVPPPRLPPPPPPPEAEEVEVEPSRHEPVKRLSVPPAAPPRPPPPPPQTDFSEEEQVQDENEQEELPPPIHRELRPPVHPPVEQMHADQEFHAPEVTHLVVDHHEQPVIHSGALREDYEDNTHVEEVYEELDYEGREQDIAEDDDPIEALVHPAHRHTLAHALPQSTPESETHDDIEEGVQQEEEAPPPPPRRPPVPDAPPIRRPSMEHHTILTSPPPVPKPAPILVMAPAKDEREVLADSDGDPIDPGFYSPPKSPRTQPLPAPTSPDYPDEPTPQPEAAHDEEEDPEQARRRTIAERMAKLGGIRFGAPPPPPPVRRPQPPPEAQDNEESAAQEPEAEAGGAPEEEEDEYARKQRIAARIAGMGGMRFGMLPGAPPPVPKPQIRPTSPSSHSEEHPTSPTVPHRAPPAVPPPPPPPVAESSEDDGERIEAEMSEAEEVTYEEAQEIEEEAPPIPSREGRHVSHADVRRPPVPQTSRPPVPQVPVTSQPKRMSTGSGTDASADFTYPPPPPPRRPSIPTHDTQNDFVMVGDDTEGAEEPPPPPPRTVSLKKTHHHPPARNTPLPPPLSAEPATESGIPHVDFGGETDLSLSGQWSEDPNVPPPPPTKGEFVQPSASRPDVQLSAEELMKQWGRVGVQIHETASVLYEKSKKSLVGDGSYLGFITAVLSQVPNASHPAPPFDNLGYLIYMQTGGSVQRRVTDVMPGDLIVIQEAKFKGHKGLQSYHQTAGVGEPLYAIVSDYEQKKSKVRVFQANQHVGQQTVESVSYRLEDLKSGSIKIFRVLEA